MATQTIPSWLEKYGRKFEIERRRREQVELAASQIVELLHARIARLSEIVESAHGLALRLTDPRPAEFERHSGIGFEIYHERRSVKLVLLPEQGQLVLLRNNAPWGNRPPTEYLDINITGLSETALDALHFDDQAFRLITMNDLLEMVFVPVAFPESLWKEVAKSGEIPKAARAAS